MSDKFLILKERSTQCLEGSRVEARLAQATLEAIAIRHGNTTTGHRKGFIPFG
jgi:hypothetical protein